MPQYQYTARNAAGRNVRGSAHAADESELYQSLREQELYLLSAKIEEKAGRRMSLKTPQVADFCQQLGVLLKAGVTLVRALNIIAEEEGLKPAVREVYENLLTEIRRGVPLSAAMEAQGNAFPSLLINMFRAAEGMGGMDKAAQRMADHYQKEHKLNQKVKGAMVYPMVILALTVLLMIFVMAYIVPQFQPMFDAMPSLPLLTRMLLGLSDFIVQRWYVLVIAAVFIFLIWRYLATVPAVRLWLDKYKLKLPIAGKLLSTIYTARLARTLSTLYSSGIPMISALQTGYTTVGNSYIAMQFEQVIDMVRSGERLSRALDSVDGLKKKLTLSVRVGEETGSLDTMLATMSDGMDYESEQSIQKLVSLLEPMLIIFMGLVVALVVIGVMLPIFNSYSTFGGDVGAI